MIRQTLIPGIGGVLVGELIVDLFAGGGGASHGIEQALGRSPDIAINHDPHAVKMHEANHPATHHYCESVYNVDPRKATKGQPVGLLWLSPDCRHFSRAKGGAPVSKAVRGLAWIGLRWAKYARPRVVCLENVPEFQTWGPLKDGLPDPERTGETFQAFVREWRRYGYHVEWRTLIAADHGAPTTRKRLFLVARCDGEPITWPEPTHGKLGKPRPWRTAAECIDWSIPCPSIFDRKKPLAPATCRRIARGIARYVLQGKPFLVTQGYGERAGQAPRVQSLDGPLGTAVAGGIKQAVVSPVVVRMGHGEKQWNSADEPLTTVTAQGNHHAIVAPIVVQVAHGDHVKRPGDRATGMDAPIGAVTKTNNHGLVAAFLAKHNGGHEATGSGIEEPVHTITGVDTKAVVAVHLTTIDQQSNAGGAAAAGDPVTTVTTKQRHAVVAASLMINTSGHPGASMDSPAPTVTTGGHHGLVAASLIEIGQRHERGDRPVDAPLGTVMPTQRAALVAAFLVQYYSQGSQDQSLDEPMATVVTRARHGLVTVTIEGEDYVVVDIGMRMLAPRELANAQGFDAGYTLTGTKSQQIARIGNSVCPPVAAAVVGANLGPKRPGVAAA